MQRNGRNTNRLEKKLIALFSSVRQNLCSKNWSFQNSPQEWHHASCHLRLCGEMLRVNPHCGTFGTLNATPTTAQTTVSGARCRVASPNPNKLSLRGSLVDYYIRYDSEFIIITIISAIVNSQAISHIDQSWLSISNLMLYNLRQLFLWATINLKTKIL